MNTSEIIDKFISENGDNTRDALNVALTKLAFSEKQRQYWKEQAQKEFNQAAAEYSSAPPVTEYKSEQKKLSEKLEQSQAPDYSAIQIHAIMNFWYAQRNLSPYKLMKKIFKDFCDPDMIDWIEALYEKANYKLDDLIRSLSEDYRGHLIKFVMREYKGVRMEDVEKYYLSKRTEI